MSTTLYPRSTATDDEQLIALSAPVHDPTWLLARQWQTGELRGSDGGDPVHVSVAPVTAPITVQGGAEVVLTQPAIEAEPVPSPESLDTASRVHLSAELFRMLRDNGMPDANISSVRHSLALGLPLHPVTADASVASHRARLPDAAALLELLRASLAPDGSGQPFPAIPGLDTTENPQVESAMRLWYPWARAQLPALGRIDDSAPSHWDPAHLSYRISAHSHLPAGDLTLFIDSYEGTGLDWYDLDRSSLPTVTPTGSLVAVRPTAVTYPGMPEPRFWAFERGDVNLDLIAGTDAAHSLLATFAHAYSNDWFLIPLDVVPGATLINQLNVTDSFGATTTIPSAAATDAPDGAWQMWELTPTSPAADDGALGVRAFLPPAPPPLQGPVIDDVLVARDEMANLAWLIELTTRDDDGGAVDRARRWLRLRPPTDPTYNPATSGDAASYRLGTSLPDHWYPLIGSTEAGRADLALAELPEGAADISDAGVTGHTVPHAKQTVLADEEASRTGTRITRVNRLTYETGARTSWRARVRQPGRGEASSGLRFDVLGIPAVPPNLVANPDFVLARRKPPGALSGQGIPGLAAAEDWTLWNNPHTTTTSTVEPTTRPGGTGWMLRITTGAGGCGLVQQWAPTGSGPAAALAEAWVFVVHGSVILGSGNGGNIQQDVVSTTIGQWEHLSAPSGVALVNEVIVYAQPPAGAVFLVDFVAVRPVGHH